MSWEDFLDIKIDSTYTGQALTDIECPKCGRNIYLDKTSVLTTYPCTFRYWCSCGWEGNAPERWIGGKDGEIH